MIQGTLVEYRVYNRPGLPIKKKRGNVSDFSPAARLRMLKHFHRIDYENHPKPLFVTLTYPDEIGLPDHATRNIHRQHMHRRLERELGASVPAAWRMEWQNRKSGTQVDEYIPHWHWLIFKHRFIHFDLINQLWRDTIKYQGYTRTDIRAVDKATAILSYMAKYIAKDAVSCSLVIAANHTKLGRQYGWLRKRDIPMMPITYHYPIPDDLGGILSGMASEVMPGKSERQDEAFSLMGQRAVDAAKILSGQRLDIPPSNRVH